MSAVIYHPNGSMCAVCKNSYSDCSKLDFKEMRVIKQYSGGNYPTVFKIVKCSSFDQGEKI